MAKPLVAQTADKTIDFKAKETGVFKTSSAKEFYVIPFEGKSAKDLYYDVLMNVSRLYNSPDKLIYKIEEKAIFINSEVNELMEAPTTSPLGGTIRQWFDFFYKIEIDFKDGKIRVNAPDIIGGRIRMGSRTLQNAETYPGNFVLLQLFKDDKTKVPILENYLNELIGQIVYGDSNSDW